MKHEKLVRDKMPQIIKDNGDTANTRVLDDTEYKTALKTKLKEEVSEFLESEKIEELADILEVIHALLESKNSDFAQLETIRKQKLDKRGGFSDKIYLIETN